MTDSGLAWTVAAVATALAVVVPLLAARARGTRREAASADSWERMEERRRRKERVYGGLSYVLLFVCAAVAAALSFHGLVGFGRQNLGLSDGWEYLVPFGLDGAAMFCSVLAVREASHGDAALGSRTLVWIFAGASAWFNWVHAPRGELHAGAPQFFAGMSLAAAVLFDRALKQTRRAALREQGLVPRPLPQIRVVRWLRAPRETYAAWSLMLLEGVRTLDEAVEEVREDRRSRAEKRQRQRMVTRRERAELRALGRRHRGAGRQRPAREIERLPALAGAGREPLGTDPAIAPAATTPASTGPLGAAGGSPAPAGWSTPPAGTAEQPPPPATAGEPSSAPEPARRTVDLTAEDDTLSIPRLDSLERKLRELERALG
ncbi:hypothetical protein FHU37_000223 [Allostreptomyces psammosilenae]|uniref:DUF2637 domain-containing protein n=2 Tax=Allostreptomyces psammosilenae TaxID=1892865 RepID=A0A852ZPU6_9ACTN|nr:hypothetical protein [Allostreptomyces psammosilenae]